MIYQRSLKADAARHNGVPFSDYALMPYSEWATVRAAFLLTHDMRGRRLANHATAHAQPAANPQVSALAKVSA